MRDREYRKESLRLLGVVSKISTPKRTQGIPTMREQEPGSVSHGTMRPEDLIPTFLDALIITSQNANAVSGIQRRMLYSSYWEKTDCTHALKWLFEQLDSQAPEGHYFGAHEGDGADYGFWPVEDDS